MLKKSITYTDFNDTERTRDFYFNLSKAELTEMEIGQRGGMETYLTNIVNNGDEQKILDVLKRFIGASYGVRSDDGSEFIKNLEGWESFKGGGAYDALFMEMVENNNLILTFMTEIIPAELRSAAAAKRAEENATPVFRPGANTERPTPKDPTSPVADVPPATVPAEPAAVPSEPVITEEPVIPNDPSQFTTPAETPVAPTQVPSPDLAKPFQGSLDPQQ